MTTRAQTNLTLTASLGLLCIVMCLLFARNADASELVVVEDRGGEDASPYFKSLMADPPQPGPKPKPRASVSEADMLPVESRSVSPGAVERRGFSAPGLRPFFMVGADEMSLEWLSVRAEALIAMGAVGMAVNVASEAELEQIRAAAPGLKILPTAGDDVAGRLRLKHYPVLITATSIEQ